MGPDETTLKNGEIMYYSDNGICFEPIPKPPLNYTIPELDSSYFDDFCTIGFDLAKGQDTTIYDYLEFPHKKMSRKKFKKWLMHFPWIDRNEAEAYCCLIAVAKGRISYSATYHDTTFIMSFERPGIALFNSFARQLKETEKQS